MNMLKENGEYSLTRIFAVIGYISFMIASGYLIYNGKTWGNYDTFAALTGGGGAATQIANKFINSKYNTANGEAGKPIKEVK